MVIPPVPSLEDFPHTSSQALFRGHVILGALGNEMASFTSRVDERQALWQLAGLLINATGLLRQLELLQPELTRSPFHLQTPLPRSPSSTTSPVSSPSRFVRSRAPYPSLSSPLVGGAALLQLLLLGLLLGSGCLHPRRETCNELWMDDSLRGLICDADELKAPPFLLVS